MLLLEHNRCCIEVAPDEGYEGDEVSVVISAQHDEVLYGGMNNISIALFPAVRLCESSASLDTMAALKFVDVISGFRG